MKNEKLMLFAMIFTAQNLQTILKVPQVFKLEARNLETPWEMIAIYETAISRNV